MCDSSTGSESRSTKISSQNAAWPIWGVIFFLRPLEGWALNPVLSTIKPINCPESVTQIWWWWCRVSEHNVLKTSLSFEAKHVIKRNVSFINRSVSVLSSMCGIFHPRVAADVSACDPGSPLSCVIISKVIYTAAVEWPRGKNKWVPSLKLQEKHTIFFHLSHRAVIALAGLLFDQIKQGHSGAFLWRIQAGVWLMLMDICALWGRQLLPHQETQDWSRVSEGRIMSKTETDSNRKCTVVSLNKSCRWARNWA